MRRSLACTALIVGLALTGCSSGGGTATAGSAPTKAGETTAAQPASGDLDCSGLTKEDRLQFIVSTQLLAQVRDQSTLDSIRNKTIGNYTPDAFAALLAKMQFLAGHPVAGLGDPADSLAFYAKANDSVRALLAISGDVPKADFDAYQAQVGGASSVVMKQLPINAAISEYCPKGT